MATRSGPRSRSSRPPARSAPAPSTRSPDAWIAAGLVVVALLAHGGALGAGWIWDDDDYVTANATLRSLDGLRRIWCEPGAVPQYYPITFTSLWVQYQLWGLAPFGYHLTNVLLHALNAVLAWRVLRRLAVPGAVVAAAIFAVHPVHVESVAWVTERKNVLSGAATLGALLAYLRVAGIPEAAAGNRSRAYALAVGLFVLAMLSKTVACTLPVVLLVIIWWKRSRITVADVVPLLPFFAIGLALGAGTIWMERHHVGAVGTHFSLSAADRVLVAGRAVWFYATKLLWPAPLIFVYPRWQVDATATWQWLFPVAAVAAAAALRLLERRVGRGPFAAVAVFVVTLAPALGFVDAYPMRYSFVADHFQYLASLAVIALAVGGVATWIAGRPPVRSWAPGIGAGVVVVLAVLSGLRTQAFQDAPALWRDTLAKNPGATMAHVNLGLLLHQEGRSAEAAEHFTQAIALEPEEADVHDDLAIALSALGRTDQALAEFAAALARDGRRAETHNNMANLLASLGRSDEAIAHYRAALALRARYPEAESNLANVLAMQGDVAGAVGLYQAAIAQDPAYVDAHHNLAVLLAAGGKGGDALLHFAEVARLRPDQPEAQLELGTALVEQGREADGVARYRQALAMRPGWPAAARALAWVLATSPDAARRDGAQAVTLAERACGPSGDAACLDTLAAAYAEAGRYADAVRTGEAALVAAKGSTALADAIRARVDGYRAGRPYRAR